MPRPVTVFASGDPVPAALRDHLVAGAYVIAADAGLHVADSLECPVDLVVGDLDSVDPGRLARAEAAGTRVERHPVDKDRTDLAIALDTALELAPATVTVVGGGGGRLDHWLANTLLLASPRYAPLRLVARTAAGTVTVVRDHARLAGTPGDLVSLLPAHGDVDGVVTDGLAFPLRGEPLAAGSSRGVSNRLVAPVATIRLAAGVLLVVQPAAPIAPTSIVQEDIP